MPFNSLRYLATMLGALKLLCKVFPLAANTVRAHIPTEHLGTYDVMVDAVNEGCEMLQTITFTT